MSTRTGRPAATSVSSARSGKRFPMSLGRLLPFLAPAPLVGGQAVMEGVMMRNGDVYALAVARPTATSASKTARGSASPAASCSKPFLRGFHADRNLVNGIKALNLSAERSTEGTERNSRTGSLSLPSSCASVRRGLFVVVPHLLDHHELDRLGGDVEGFSFHIWDGLFKFLILSAHRGHRLSRTSGGCSAITAPNTRRSMPTNPEIR
ncbi:MAG: hypothetical protein ACLSAH_17895 [Bilophila wadsworthia]